MYLIMIPLRPKFLTMFLVSLDSFVGIHFLLNRNPDMASASMFLVLGIYPTFVPYFLMINLHQNAILVLNYLQVIFYGQQILVIISLMKFNIAYLIFSQH